jgi:hypothetical protein
MLGNSPIILPARVGTGITNPGDQGMTGWSFDPASVVAGSATISGVLYLVKLIIPRNDTVNKLYWYLTNSAVTPTAGQNEVGIIDSVGNRLVAANVDASLTPAGLKVITLADTAVTAGFVWAAMVFNAATPPSLARGTSISSGSLTNAGLLPAAYRFATNGTGRTSIPASITPGSNALHDFALWCGVGR